VPPLTVDRQPAFGVSGGRGDHNLRVLLLGHAMRLIALSILTFLTATLFTIYGTLLAWRPDLFLRFHDSFVDRGRWNRSAAWRKSLGGLDAKVVAASFVMFGLFIIYIILTGLISKQN
jgi:hypothetical protein